MNSLTPSELRVLAAVADIGMQKRAAEHLGMPLFTVKNQLTQARRKLGARNTTHAVALLIRSGL